MPREDYDRKYNSTHPLISFRIDHELLEKINGNRSQFIVDAIREKLNASPKDHNSLQEYLIFLFQFFQKNASNLNITEDERSKLKEILGVIRDGRS